MKMAIVITKGSKCSPEKTDVRRMKFGAFLSAEDTDDGEFNSHRYSSARNSDASFSSGSPPSDNPALYSTSPNTTVSSLWSQDSPYTKSPWIRQVGGEPDELKHGLIGSIYREEGHVYSLAAAGDLLYTGSDSKNIRVWRNLEEFAGFKSSSGLVKAIVVHENRLFTGHQDGRIRVWSATRARYKRVGSLPTTGDLLRKSINPRNYVEARRHKNVPWIKHYDAVSCLSIDREQGLLYSGSWDKTLKVWRISDSKCLESVQGHDDALNAVVVAFDGLIFTGSADGTVKAWRRELVGKSAQHVLVETLLRQDHAVTSLAVSPSGGGVLYAGTSDGLVSFWERRNRFMVFGGVLRGHKQGVLCLAAAGNLVMSGSTDMSICVWRREEDGAHSCVSVLTAHTGPVKCLAVEKEEQGAETAEERWILYSGSLDKSVKVWRVSEFGLSLGKMQDEE